MSKKEVEQTELLGLLTEECAEVIQAISKAGRFGLDNVYEGVSNRAHLQQEVGDVIALIIILTRKHPDLMSDETLDAAVTKKIKRLKKRIKSLRDFTLDEPNVTQETTSCQKVRRKS